MDFAGSNQEWFERLDKVMPYGSSTCSKRAQYRPDEPAVIVRGKGCRVWDADGREFIDFRNSLGPVTLGYQFPAVDEAIRRQLGNGIVFGHPHPLECEVAEAICSVIPCAEQARFLKTGGEAIAACIRLARYVTGREHVIQIGYNGWLNSLAAGGRVLPGQVATSAPAGVPLCLASLHHAAGWNDIQSVAQVFADYPRQVAAVVVASGYESSTDGTAFYPALRQLTRQEGALLIYDEIVTGFRIAIGGAQEYFKTTPDLAVFAKGVANGMPLSVYCGRAEYMTRMNKVTVSSTYGGEALSLAAAKAAIDVYRTQGVIAHLWHQGERLCAGLNHLFQKHGVPVSVQGYAPMGSLRPRPDAPKDTMEKLFRAAYRAGISTYHVSYVNFSHSDADIAEALERWSRACRDLG